MQLSLIHEIMRYEFELGVGGQCTQNAFVVHEVKMQLISLQ